MGFVLKVDGKKWKTPAHGGWKITREKIWSANTRRTSSGKMQGTIIAIKTTLDMAFPPSITKSELQTIKNSVDSKEEWHELEFTNELGEVEKDTFYFGNPSYEGYAFLNGKMILSSISIQAVNK